MKPHDLVDSRFEIERLAGSGGMGKVYRALDRRSGQLVALKVLHGQMPEHVDRFVREASLLAELRHPGIVGFVARGTTADGQVYLVMDWLDGESLSQRLDRGIPSIAETLALGGRAAEALHAAHVRGVVHRDLKPGNIFLPGGDVTRPVLVDFGIARVNEPGQTLTRTGSTLGTPGYMSPEQARGDRSVDGRADLFSLACVLYRCLAGAPPFTGDAFTAMLKAVMEPAPPLSSFRGDLPPALTNLIDRMLAKSPDGRPRDALAVAAELSAIAAGAPATAVMAPLQARPSTLPSPPTLTPLSMPMGMPPAAPALTAARITAFPASVPPGGAAPAGRAPHWWPMAAIAGAIAGSVLLTLTFLVLIGALHPSAFLPMIPGGAALQPPACYNLRCVDVTYADAAHVDAMEVFPRALKIAQSIDRSAALCGISLVGTTDGTMPIPPPSGGALSLRFATSKSTRGLDVSPIPGRIVANESYCSHVVPVPACTPRAAYRAAVASGAARGSTILTYELDTTTNVGTWTFFTTGHPDSMRKVDGRTCAITYRAPR